MVAAAYREVWVMGWEPGHQIWVCDSAKVRDKLNPVNYSSGSGTLIEKSCCFQLVLQNIHKSALE
jgi:hypothetical protein